MYEITLNGKTLYHPNSDDCIVTNAVIHEALNDSGYMDITVPYVNPLYNELTERKGKIIVYKNNVESWYGELRDIGKDFSKNKTLYVVGEASYLNDSVQPQKEYKTETKFQVFEKILAIHNSQVESDRQFQPGVIGKGANSIVHIVTDWEYSLDAIRTHLCGEEEYIRIRHINKVKYIDIMPLETYGKRSEQVIAFGENLLDYTEESSGEKIATVCIPLGVQLEEEKIEGYTNYLTCESANNGKNYVELPGAVQRLGKIRKVVHFNVINTAEALVTAAKNYLTQNQYARLSLKLSAIDMSMLSNDIDNYSVGDYARALCEPLEMDTWFPIREKETDILNLANNKIKMGADSSKSMTRQQSESITTLQEESESVKSSAVQAAFRNASMMINSNGEDGYISIRTDDNKKPYEIVICNASTLKQSTHAWRWNLSGFGHGTKKAGADNFEWSTDVAITIDGNIVANYITTGTMLADRIRGGVFEVGGSGLGKDGKIVIKNTQGKDLITLDKNGITLTNGQKIQYSDISNTPTIPSKTSQLQNDSGFKTVVTANDITTGTMLADRIKGGELVVGGKDAGSKDGKIIVKNADGATIVTLDGETQVFILGGFTIHEDKLSVGDAVLSPNAIGCGVAGKGIVNIVGNKTGQDGKYGYIQISNSGDPSKCIGGIRIYGNGKIVRCDETGTTTWVKYLSNIPDKGIGEYFDDYLIGPQGKSFSNASSGDLVAKK